MQIRYRRKNLRFVDGWVGGAGLEMLKNKEQLGGGVVTY